MDDEHERVVSETEKQIQSGITLIGFESLLCDPCRVQEPIIQALAERFRGAARILDLNIDEHRKFAIRLGITSVPTLILFKDGKELRRFVGLQSADVLSEAIEAISAKP